MIRKLRIVLPEVACLLLAIIIATVISRSPAPARSSEEFGPRNASGKIARNGSPSGESQPPTKSLTRTKSHSSAGPLSNSISSEATSQVTTSAPPGPSVGFLLSEIDSSLLTAEEDATLFEVQKKFADMMAECPVQDPTSPQYHRQWKQAQEYCDSLLRLRLGHDGFNRMNFLASQESERAKNH